MTTPPAREVHCDTCGAHAAFDPESGWPRGWEPVAGFARVLGREPKVSELEPWMCSVCIGQLLDQVLRGLARLA